MRRCRLRTRGSRRGGRTAAAEQPAAEATPQETPELPAETVALCRAGKPARRAALKAGPIYQHRFRDAKPINFGKSLAEATRRPRRRRVALAGQHRLAEAAQPGRELRLHQSDRRRRSPRSDVQEELARRRAGRPEARRLPLLLLVPHRRRAGRLVHPQRAEGRGRAAAGHRRRVERRFQLQAAPVARQGAGEDAGLHGQGSRRTTASARSSTPARTSTATISRARS